MTLLAWMRWLKPDRPLSITHTCARRPVSFSGEPLRIQRFTLTIFFSGVTRLPKMMPLGNFRSKTSEPSLFSCHSSGSSVLPSLSQMVGMCVWAR